MFVMVNLASSCIRPKIVDEAKISSKVVLTYVFK